MTRTICIYHGNCADGFTAAWAVWKALGDEVEFIPATYGDEPPDVVGADVIIVDFSYKRPVIEAMEEQARSILILDHHETARDDLAGFPRPYSDWELHHQSVTHWDELSDAPCICAVFDMDRSGAQLAWDYFHMDHGYHSGMPLIRPALVDYIADRDLWRFDLPHSRAAASWYFSRAYDFHEWQRMADQLKNAEGFSAAVAEGIVIDRKHAKDIAELLSVTRREMVICGYRVPVANLPYTLASDAGNLMAEGQPFAATYFDTATGNRAVSLRSHKRGVNVAKIARAYGGGGHARAAGFKASRAWEGEEP